MFENNFRGKIESIGFKGKEPDQDLITLKIGCVLNEEMMENLGSEIRSMVEGVKFSNATIPNALEGLAIDLWRSEEDMAGDPPPMLSLSGLSTKKYKLNKDPDTGAVIFTSVFTSADITDAALVTLRGCRLREVLIKVDFGPGYQESLNLGGV